MRVDTDVLIVGAGPAGSAAAITLARRGRRVTLIDRALFPRDKPCGDYCNPGAAQALRDLECLSEVMAAGASPIPGMVVVAADGTMCEARFPQGRGLLIPRRRLDAALLDRAARAGADVIEGWTAAEVCLDGNGVEIRSAARDTHRIRARLAIGADGRSSVIARHLGLRAGIPSGRYTVGAYFSGLPQTAPNGELHLGDGFYCGVAHFGGGAANVCMALPRAFFARRTEERVFADALRRLPRLADAMTGARRESAFRSAGPVGFGRSRLVKDRIMLAGDAAAPMEPMTGQGIYHALRSGILAAEGAASALEGGDRSDRPLHRYARRHAREFAGTRAVARALQLLAFRPRLTPYLIRRLAARPALAGRLLGVTGDVAPPSSVLMPQDLLDLLVGSDADGA